MTAMKVEWIERETREPIYEMVRKRKALKPEIIEYGDRGVEQQQLAKVRQELAGMPTMTVVIAVEKAQEPEPEPETLGGKFVKWVLSGVGLLLALTGEAVEKAAKKEERG